MRLAEKTIELNFCAEFAKAHPGPVFWFGLTQTQEAKAGFDAATRLGKRLLLFQVKASNHIVKGRRRFKAQHHQMQALQKRIRGATRSVFYVLPNIGDTSELGPKKRILDSTWLLDVATLKNPFPAPTIRKSTKLRKSALHYIDIDPPKAIIHSEPVEAQLLSALTFASDRSLGADGVGWAFDGSFEQFQEVRTLMARGGFGLVID